MSVEGIKVELVAHGDSWRAEAVTASGQTLLRSRILLTREAALVEAERMTKVIETQFGSPRQ